MPISEAGVAKFVGPSWAPHLVDLFNTKTTQKIVATLKQERDKYTVFPEQDDIFRAFRECPYDETRVVILGQDPYHTPGKAHGLAFSVPETEDPPPSLRNIFRELEEDLGFVDPSPSPDLTRWARQGVLLLNTALTVREGQAGTHADLWTPFTQSVLQTIIDRFHPTIFVTWGSHARNALPPIDPFFHTQIQSVHPSPLSAHRGFFGSKPFSKVNAALEDLGLDPIDWYRS